MSANAIKAVTEGLAGLLSQGLADAQESRKLFVGAPDHPDAADAALILLLYRITPNASLRNSEHRTAGDDNGGAPVVHTNSLALDLRYLLMVGVDKQPGLHLLAVLGRAMQTLNAYPHLPGVAGAPDPVHVSLEPQSTEELSRIWSLYPTVNYRTSVAYIASPAWIDPPLPPPAGAPVIHDTPLVGARWRGNDG